MGASKGWCSGGCWFLLCPAGVVGTISMLKKRQENQGQKNERHKTKMKITQTKQKRLARLPYKGTMENAHGPKKI